jgi:hypothetical protein
MGTQKRFPVPWSKEVVVKKYAVLGMADDMRELVLMESGKKSRAVSTMAMVGPAARKLQMAMVKQRTVVM